MTEQAAAKVHVGRVLLEAGIPASGAELDELASAYVKLRAGIDLLYAVEEAREELPATTFAPGTPTSS